jgi:large subunit GTPase 1
MDRSQNRLRSMSFWRLQSWPIRTSLLVCLPPFLLCEELENANLDAERMNYITVVHNSQQNPYLLTPEQEKIAVRKQNSARGNLTVPRRPAWDEHTTPTELDRLERDSFLQWRRGLAELQENLDLLMTPFERNLEMWRQLWRVIERSDLIVQIVDARNPLMFRSEDLEKYVQEVDKKKRNLLLVNKADMMTYAQRKAWADYFEKEGIQYKFFSAHLAKEELEKAELEDLTDSQSEDEDLAEEATKKLDLKEEEKQEDDRTRILKIDELEDLFLSNTPDVEGMKSGSVR